MHSNQKGLSLAEILAGIVLLGIITTLTTIIITNSFDRNDTSAKEISLKQDTNLMISQLRKEFYDGEDADKPEDNIICLDDQQGRVQVDLERSRANKKKLELKNEKVCIKGFDRHDPLHLNIFTKNDNEKQVIIETTLKKGGNKKVNYGYAVKDIDVCDSKDFAWSGAKKVDKLPCGNSGAFEVSSLSGDFSGKDKCIIDGDLLVKGQFQPKNLNLEVNGHVCFVEQTQPETSTITIKKNASFKNSVQIEKNSDITIKNHAYFGLDGQKNFHNSSVYIGKNAYFKNNFQIKDGKQEYTNPNEFYIGGDASFTNQFEIEDSATMEIGNDATFDGKTMIQKASTLIVKGNLTTTSTQDIQLNKSSLYVYKNAYLRKKIEDKEKIKLCIKGIVTPSSNTPELDNSNPCIFP